MRTVTIAEQVRQAAHEPEEELEECVPHELLSTGSTLLNLAMSDHATGGIAMGKMVHIVGDSSSGKTFLAYTILAECANDPRFAGHRLIYDDAERASEFAIARLFGKTLLDRLTPPVLQDDEPLYSTTIQDFEEFVFTSVRQGPCVYVLDSFDAITSDQEMEKTNKFLKVRASGSEKKLSGSYGMDKAKAISALLRKICATLASTKSILIILSQTRDNTDEFSFETKTYSGGRALKFYATHQLWLSPAGKLKRKDRMVGVLCKVQVKKNKLTGKWREVQFPIFYDYGLDDIGSSIDFMVTEEFWKTEKQTILGLGLRATRETLIRAVEEDPNLKRLLVSEVGKAWAQIEKSLETERPPRYS